MYKLYHIIMTHVYTCVCIVNSDATFVLKNIDKRHSQYRNTQQWAVVCQLVTFQIVLPVCLVVALVAAELLHGGVYERMLGDVDEVLAARMAQLLPLINRWPRLDVNVQHVLLQDTKYK